MNIKMLEEKLKLVWSKETSNSPDKWRKKTPSIGQCAVTALIVNDLYGGLILRGQLEGDSHYWNLINDKIIDFTGDQYKDPLSFSAIGTRSREYLFENDDLKRRYNLLKKLLTDQGVKFQ
jgi:hypothetical protein